MYTRHLVTRRESRSCTSLLTLAVVLLPTTLCTQAGELIIEAENAASLLSPLRVISDSTASGGAFVSTPTKHRGAAVFELELSSSGVYTLAARVRSPARDSNSFTVEIDGAAAEIWHLPVTSGFEWQVFSEDLHLEAGAHTLVIHGREQDTDLDVIRLTTDAGDSTPDGNPAIEFTWEAEDADSLESPMGVEWSSEASQGEYISTARKYQGRARYAFEAALSGTYGLAFRARTPSGDSNSIYVSVDGGSEKVWHMSVSSGFRWQVFSENLHFGAGPHELVLRGRENDTDVDQIRLYLLDPPPGIDDSAPDDSTPDDSAPDDSAPDRDLATELTWEAEEADSLESPMGVEWSSEASQGECISTARKYQGRARYAFEVALSGTYGLAFRVRTPSGDANSIYVSVDGGSEKVWHMSVSSGFGWQVFSEDLHLDAGRHELVLRGRENDTEVDQIRLYLVDAPPEGNAPAPGDDGWNDWDLPPADTSDPSDSSDTSDTPDKSGTPEPEVPSAPQGAIFYVSPTGQNGNTGSTTEDPFRTIQFALEIAEPGDTIVLGDGDYFQDVRSVRSGTPDLPIRITGSPEAVIRGAGEARVVQINHSYIVLDGFTIDGLHGDPSRMSGYRDKLIYVQGRDRDGVVGLRILNLRLRNAGGECVRMKYFARRNEVAHCTFTNCGVYDYEFDDGGKNGEAVYIGTAPEQLNRNPSQERDESNDNWIHDNTFDTNGNECVDIKEGSSNNLVEHNICTGQLDPNSGGMGSRGSANIFRFNVIFGCLGAGVRLGGDEQTDGIDNEVYGNEIFDNARGAVKVMRLPQARICGNTTYENGGEEVVGPGAGVYTPGETCE